jgi:long-chain acyl-CoA synthetase
MAGSGEVVTYRELEARSNQGAQLFRRLGLQRGDVIALLLDNVAEFFALVWAAQRAGLYYVCISTRLVASEVAFILEDSDARILITGGAMPDELSAEVDRLGITLFTLDGAHGRDFLAERSAQPATPIADESPGNDMLYSSGTTGRPKGIKPPLPDGALAESNALTELGRGTYGMDADTVFLSPAPLYHAAGRHGGHHGKVRCRAGAGRDRKVSGDPRAMGPHSFHPHAQAR